MRANCWNILGIEPTGDRRAIKRAYAKQSGRYHPEDDPDAFQALQEAYQEALAYQQVTPAVTWSPSDDGDLQPHPIHQPMPSSNDLTFELNEEDLLLDDEDEKLGEGKRKQQSGQQPIIGEELTDFQAEESDEQGHDDVAEPSLGRRSLFKSHELEHQGEKERFLRQMAKNLPNDFTAADLSPYLNQALRRDYLNDELFKESLEELILSASYATVVVNVSRLRKLAERYQLQVLEGVYRRELLRRGYPLEPYEQKTPKPERRQTFKAERQSLADRRREQEERDRRAAEEIREKTKPALRHGIRLLAGFLAPLILALVRLGRVQNAVPQSSVTIPPSELVSKPYEVTVMNETAHQALKALAAQAMLKEENGVYSLMTSTSPDPVPLPGVTQAYVLPVEGDETHDYLVASSTDGILWVFWDKDGKQAGSTQKDFTLTGFPEEAILVRDGAGFVFSDSN